jgi:hypothetical protein
MMAGCLPDIIPYADQGQQEEQPEKSPPPASVPFRTGRGKDQGRIFFQGSRQLIPIRTICPERVLVGSPFKEIVNIIAF